MEDPELDVDPRNCRTSYFKSKNYKIKRLEKSENGA